MSPDPASGAAVRAILSPVAVAVLIAMTARPAMRFGLALGVLDDLRRPGRSWLTARTRAPHEAKTRLVGGSQSFDADLYLPASGGSRVPVLLIPGLVELGKDDPRVAPFARMLARAGFTVVVPDLPSMRTLRIHLDNAREIIAAHAALCARADLAPRGSAGLFGISFAGGLALLAALNPARAKHVPFVATVGAYADLDTAVRFLVTGVLHDRGTSRTVRVDPYGRMVFTRTYEEFMSDAADRDGLEAIIARRTSDPAAGIADLVATLGPEGRLVVELYESGDSARLDERIAALPAGLCARMADLSPGRLAFAGLHARLYLVHARDDGTFPSTESDRLARLASPHVRVRLVRLDALQHVSIEPWQRDPWRLITRDIPEGLRLAGWWAALLRESR